MMPRTSSARGELYVVSQVIVGRVSGQASIPWWMVGLSSSVGRKIPRLETRRGHSRIERLRMDFIVIGLGESVDRGI